MWKSTRKKKKGGEKENSTLGKSYAFLLILQLVTRPLSPVSRIHYSLFSLSKVRFFCDSRTVHMTLRNNGLRSFPGRPRRTSGLWSRAYILVGSRIIRLQSFALNHEANDASWRWSRRGKITEWNWFKQTPPGRRRVLRPDVSAYDRWLPILENFYTFIIRRRKAFQMSTVIRNNWLLRQFRIFKYFY